MRRFEVLSDEERVDRYKALGKKALLAYGLSPDLLYVSQGRHVVFRASIGGGTFAVRIGEAGRDQNEVRRELLWLAALGRDTPLAVPEPLLTIRGDLFTSVSMEGVPGARSCSVVRWMEGERREAELTADEVSAIGALTAELHRHAERFRWPEEIAPTYENAADRCFAACDAIRPFVGSPEGASLLTEAAALIADHTPTSGDAGPIHGDLRLRRFRLKQGVAGVLGFGHCRLGTDLEDLAPLWIELSARRAGDELKNALLDGYRSVRPLSSSQEPGLRAHSALRALETAAHGLGELRRDRRSKSEAAEEMVADLRRDLSAALAPAVP